MLEGESMLIMVEADCIKDKKMFKGKIIMTTYRIKFIPDDPNIISHLCLNRDYFKVPLSMISRFKLLIINLVL